MRYGFLSKSVFWMLAAAMMLCLLALPTISLADCGCGAPVASSGCCDCGVVMDCGCCCKPKRMGLFAKWKAKRAARKCCKASCCESSCCDPCSVGCGDVGCASGCASGVIVAPDSAPAIPGDPISPPAPTPAEPDAPTLAPTPPVEVDPPAVDASTQRPWFNPYRGAHSQPSVLKPGGIALSHPQGPHRISQEGVRN